MGLGVVAHLSQSGGLLVGVITPGLGLAQVPFQLREDAFNGREPLTLIGVVLDVDKSLSLNGICRVALSLCFDECLLGVHQLSASLSGFLFAITDALFNSRKFLLDLLDLSQRVFPSGDLLLRSHKPPLLFLFDAVQPRDFGLAFRDETLGLAWSQLARANRTGSISSVVVQLLVDALRLGTGSLNRGDACPYFPLDVTRVGDCLVHLRGDSLRITTCDGCVPIGTQLLEKSLVLLDRLLLLVAEITQPNDLLQRCHACPAATRVGLRRDLLQPSHGLDGCITVCRIPSPPVVTSRASVLVDDRAEPGNDRSHTQLCAFTVLDEPSQSGRPFALGLVGRNRSGELIQTAGDRGVRHPFRRPLLQPRKFCYRSIPSGSHGSDLSCRRRNLPLLLRSLQLQILPAVNFLAGRVRRLFGFQACRFCLLFLCSSCGNRSLPSRDLSQEIALPKQAVVLGATHRRLVSGGSALLTDQRLRLTHSFQTE